MPVESQTPGDVRVPRIEENPWGYAKRLDFVHRALVREFSGAKRSALRILDVGSGNGSQLAVPLAEAGYQVTAVDPHRPSIERGRILAPAIDFHHGFVSDLVPGRFDCVIISEVLEHLEVPEQLLDLSLPYLAESGILIITVPNGYGEFELDRRTYRALRADKLIAWLWSVFKNNNDVEIVAGSDDESPHIQRFTLSRLRKMFRRKNLVVVEARGTSLASGPFVVHLLGRFDHFICLNASIVDRLPLSIASGWMFCLKLTQQSG